MAKLKSKAVKKSQGKKKQVVGKVVKAPRKVVRSKSKGQRPAARGRSKPLFWKVQDADMKGLVLCGDERSTDFVSAKLLYSVSEKYLHPEVLIHRQRERNADGLEVLHAMEKKYA